MKGYSRIVVLLLGMVAIVGSMLLWQGQPQAQGQPTAQGRGQAPAQAAQPQAPLAPHPSTQLPQNKVTPEQMKKWEKDLSNWGRWGKDDQKGTLNLITPQKTLAAMRLVKEGITVSLHRFPDLLEPGKREVDTGNFAETVHWMTAVEGGARYAPRPGEPKPGSHPGRVTGALDAISMALHEGPHLDALCHYSLRTTRDTKPVIFNGYFQNIDPNGCKDLAIDRMGSGYITRGILVDFPLMKGVPWLEPRLPLYVSDLEAWEKFANVKIGSGDVLIIRTGKWARREKEGPWNSGRETAGLHVSTAPWLKARDIAVIGGDVATDVIPSGVEGWGRPLHDLALPVFGTPFIDNTYTENVAREAARLKRWEFMISFPILQTPGGTATPFMGLGTF